MLSGLAFFRLELLLSFWVAVGFEAWVVDMVNGELQENCALLVKRVVWMGSPTKRSVFEKEI